MEGKKTKKRKITRKLSGKKVVKASKTPSEKIGKVLPQIPSFLKEKAKSVRYSPSLTFKEEFPEIHPQKRKVKKIPKFTLSNILDVIVLIVMFTCLAKITVGEIEEIKNSRIVPTAEIAKTYLYLTR